MNNIELSVVIPTFNELHRLPRTITEILPFLEANFKKFEILIVDDKSPDGTIEYIHSLKEKDSRFKLLIQPNRLGKGAAIRRGCIEAKGHLVLFMDAIMLLQ